MFGYPHRHQPQQRVTAPTRTLFDPSADAACTGWWRADVNLNVSNASRSLASGLTSRLADQKPLVNAASPPWIVVPKASKGFPGLIGQNEGWSASGVAVTGDRSITATWVYRFFQYRLNTNSVVFGNVTNMGGFGCFDSYIRIYHPFIGWWNVNDGQWFPFNTANISVLTMRVKPFDEAGGDLRGSYRFNWNTVQIGPFTQTLAQGDRVMNETHSIVAAATANGPSLFHEAMFFRRHLADGEVIAMHNLLLQQYGQAV